MKSLALKLSSVVCALGCFLSGCISEGQRAAEDVTSPSDGLDVLDVPDTIDPTGDGTVSNELPDVTSPDSDGTVEPETRIEETEVVTSACSIPGDCEGDLPVCTKWICPQGVCEVAPRTGGNCDDGDLCTGGGVCDSGLCVSDTITQCDNATPCHRPICDSSEGCQSEVVVAGFCEANGLKWGTCDGPRMAPIDRCDAVGTCVDGVTSNATPLPRDQVYGEWFVVSTSVSNNGMGSVAGPATFAADGTWGAQLKTEDADFTLEGAGNGWCIDADLGIAFDFSSLNHFVGQVDRSGELMVASGKAGNELLVGLRSDGFLSDVDGTYAALLTGEGDKGEMRVWTGTLVFGLGCLDEDSSFIGRGAEEPFFVESEGACFDPTARSFAEISVPIRTADGESRSLDLRGAIGPFGDVMVFSREKGESTEPGMLILVRLDATAASTFAGPTRWIYAFQEQVAGAADLGFRGFANALAFDDHVLVSGLFGKNQQVFGDNIGFDDYGRYVVSLRATSAVRTFSGYLASGIGFGFFYEVDPPENWGDVLEVSEQPSAPAYGVMLNRP